MKYDCQYFFDDSISAPWATAYLEYEIPILLKMDDLWSYKIIFKHFKQKKPAKKCLATG